MDSTLGLPFPVVCLWCEARGQCVHALATGQPQNTHTIAASVSWGCVDLPWAQAHCRTRLVEVVLAIELALAPLFFEPQPAPMHAAHGEDDRWVARWVREHVPVWWVGAGRKKKKALSECA